MRIDGAAMDAAMRAAHLDHGQVAARMRARGLHATSASWLRIAQRGRLHLTDEETQALAGALGVPPDRLLCAEDTPSGLLGRWGAEVTALNVTRTRRHLALIVCDGQEGKG